MRTLITLIFSLSLVPLVMAAPYDGSAPLLCVALTIQECANDSGACHRRRAEEVNIPQFIQIDTAQKTITSTGTENRQAAIERLTHLDGLLLMQGVQNGRAWSILIGEDTGTMSATVADDEVGFVIFGACTVR